MIKRIAAGIEVTAVVPLLTFMVCLAAVACGEARQDAVSLPPEGHEAPPPEQMAACAAAGNRDSVATPEYWRPGTFALHDMPKDWPEASKTEAAVAGGDAALRRWYSTQLCAMGEAPLSAPPAGRVRLRFLWLRTFGPGISVRVEHSRGGTRLVAIELDGAGGYAPGKVADHVERVLTPGEWQGLEAVVRRSNFWRMPSEKADLGVEGSQWIVEISEPERYHVVDRWSGGAVTEIGLQVLNLSGLEYEPVY